MKDALKENKSVVVELDWKESVLHDNERRAPALAATFLHAHRRLAWKCACCHVESVTPLYCA